MAAIRAALSDGFAAYSIASFCHTSSRTSKGLVSSSTGRDGLQGARPDGGSPAYRAGGAAQETGRQRTHVHRRQERAALGPAVHGSENDRFDLAGGNGQVIR
ncbi:MAG TPA: hypothetical protein VHK70_04190 [Burkholderiaceae bacterium]|jgi:hypothetical protein|nr:hypothetical protein [Burkholderiaceae bacterium]